MDSLPLIDTFGKPTPKTSRSSKSLCYLSHYHCSPHPTGGAAARQQGSQRAEQEAGAQPKRDELKLPHRRAIAEHPFNHRIQLLFLVASVAGTPDVDDHQDADMHTEFGDAPALSGLLPACTEIIKDQFFYYCADLPLSYLITSEFRNTYLRCGTLVALTIGTNLDTDDVVAIDGRGTLILSLTKDTYELAGLSGRPARFGRDRFTVQVDLLSLTQKQLGRLEWCFKHTITGGYPMILSFSDPVTGESKQLDLPRVSNPRKIPLEVSLETEIVRIPPFDCLRRSEYGLNNNRGGCQGWRSFIEETLEWVGAAACGAARIRPSDEAGDSVSMYAVPEASSLRYEPAQQLIQKAHQAARAELKIKGNVTTQSSELSKAPSMNLIRWTVTGLMPPTLIEMIIDRLHSDDAYEFASTDAFFCLVHGFQDSPVSWRGCEKGYHMAGDNMLGVASWRNGDLLSWQYRAKFDDY